ncbi:MAG: threonylcarbamoyl-AMP synthase [Desulfovibrionaceae bacterium]|nr:threonylcarbamoyl-AMP synthase [Desulfovibrionaceae bacterium]
MIIDTLEIKKAVQIIRQGGVVAFPTETYYGLGVDPFNPQALTKLFAIKKRSSAKPVLTLITSQEQLSLLTLEIPSLFLPLFSLWPAPLTLVFKALPSLPSRLTGGTGTVAVRISPHPLAMALVRAYRQPLTATSANISGKPPAVTADEVRMYFGDTVDLVIDGGRTQGGKPSTVVGIDNDALTVIREGVISLSEIERAVS